MRKCRLHNVELKNGKREIRRGFPPAPPDGLADAERTLFPNAKSFEIAGCVIGPDDPEESRVYFCPACREAESAWHTAHEGADFWRP